MADRSYRGLLWVLALVGLLADQASKYAVFAWLHEQAVAQRTFSGQYEVVPGVFRLVAEFTGQRPDPANWLAPLQGWGTDVLPRVNHGALFGMFRDYQHLANGVFALISILAGLAIVWWSARGSTARDGWLCAALGLILAGTLGNLYDRAVFGGVRDFLYFYWIEWPVFNVADCCLVCGAFLLLLQAFCSRPAAQPGSTPAVPEMAEAR